MKVRHINNIIIELEEHEVRPIIHALTDALVHHNRGYRSHYIITVDKLRDELQKLTEREA